VFPGKNWETAEPGKLGLDKQRLREYARRVKGDGIIVRYGRVAHQWGAVDKPRDWASAGKPVLATMLLLGVERGVIASVHAPVAEAGWALEGKDTKITYAHLANMVGGYSRAEPPGAAWAYNDVGIMLLGKSLEKRMGRPLAEVARDWLDPLQFQDGPVFGSRDGLGVILSPRDMARLGWFWLEEGRWGKQRLISKKLYRETVSVQVPSRLPRSQGKGSDSLKIGSYGGGTDQTAYGPGIYGSGFWFNAELPSGEKTWPAAPAGTYQANGAWNTHTVTVFPSLNMVVVVSQARRPGKFSPGEKNSPADRNLKILMDAVTGDRPNPW